MGKIGQGFSEERKPKDSRLASVSRLAGRTSSAPLAKPMVKGNLGFRVSLNRKPTPYEIERVCVFRSCNSSTCIRRANCSRVVKGRYGYGTISLSSGASASSLGYGVAAVRASL